MSRLNPFHTVLRLLRSIRKLHHNTGPLLTDIANDKKLYRHKVALNENVIVIVIVKMKIIPENSFELLVE